MKMSPSGEAAVLAALTTFMACGLAEQNTRDGVVRPDWSVRQGADGWITKVTVTPRSVGVANALAWP
jgi:hypothetical protein